VAASVLCAFPSIPRLRPIVIVPTFSVSYTRCKSDCRCVFVADRDRDGSVRSTLLEPQRHRPLHISYFSRLLYGHMLSVRATGRSFSLKDLQDLFLPSHEPRPFPPLPSYLPSSHAQYRPVAEILPSARHIVPSAQSLRLKGPAFSDTRLSLFRCCSAFHLAITAS